MRFWAKGWFSVLIVVLVIATSGLITSCASTETETVTTTKTTTATATATETTVVEPITLKWAQLLGRGWTPAEADAWFAEEVERRTGGRVKFDIYWAGSLATGKEILEHVKMGAVDIGTTSPGYFASEMPFNNALDTIFFTIKTQEDIQVVMRALFEEFPVFAEEYAKYNAKILYYPAAGPYVVISTSPIKNLEDMAGKKLYSWGGYVPKIIEGAGAVAVSVPPADVYDALDKGLLDGRLVPPDMINPYKFYEVAKHLAWNPIGYVYGVPPAINIDTWNSLPSDVQQIMLEVASEHAAKIVEIDAKLTAETLEAFEGHGGTIWEWSEDDITSWREASGDLVGMWIAEMEGQGMGDLARQVAARWLELGGYE